MLISLNWIRDFVDLPSDLDPQQLAERFTRTTAEVDGVSQINIDAKGLIAARVIEAKNLPDTRNLRLVTLDVGNGKQMQTVSAAPVLHVQTSVVYAPPGAGIKGHPEMTTAKVAGCDSQGLILPGESIGISMALQEAIFLPDDTPPGTILSPELFEDWVIEVDNKSITHRPDLWGHYGIAREIAAICKLPLKPYPVVTLESLQKESLPEIPIAIADSTACRRYTGLLLEGVPTQPAPLWLQLRLGHVGQRPISGLVDLTNYIMLDLGQPMHAFDAAKVEHIKVDRAKKNENFRTLDGSERALTDQDLMIQCNGKSVALAGVMGGLETEVTDATKTLLLESANFAPVTVRKTAIRLGLRTDASARFEKSLDPSHTVLAIQRFVELAKPMYPDMRVTSRLSDCYPKPAGLVYVDVNLANVNRAMGREVPIDEITNILKPLGFTIESDAEKMTVSVPSFRATGDVSIEADVIEEIARTIGYDNIEPTMPRVSVRRIEPNALHQLEQRSLEFFTMGRGFHEIHGYLWHDAEWLAQLAIDPGPCVEMKNPAANGLHLLRRSLIPNMLASIAKNRYYFTTLSMLELGSVFEKGQSEDHEFRHIACIHARRAKSAEDSLLDRLKSDIEAWAWQHFASGATFHQTSPEPDKPWRHPTRTALIRIGGRDAGYISVIDMSLRRAMDEHLTAWGIAWAEIRLSGLESQPHRTEPLHGVPEQPLIEMDFSIVVEVNTHYESVANALADFTHPLLKRMRYVGSYQGESIGQGRRSLTFKTAIGHDDRTLVDEDATAFRQSFEKYLKQCNYELRR